MNGTTVSNEIRALAPIALFRAHYPILEYAPDRNAAREHMRNAKMLLRRDTDEAISELEKALKIDKDNPEALTLMGKALMRKNRLEDALVCFTKAIELDPANTDAYSIRGMLRHALGDKQGLNEDFNACAFIKSGNGQAQKSD
jgi:cytochrome c-type biogenesis protein CcmH/NrfG